MCLIQISRLKGTRQNSRLMRHMVVEVGKLCMKPRQTLLDSESMRQRPMHPVRGEISKDYLKPLLRETWMSAIQQSRLSRRCGWGYRRQLQSKVNIPIRIIHGPSVPNGPDADEIQISGLRRYRSSQF